MDVHIPPLRERREDIPMLTHHFTAKFCKMHNLPPKRVSTELMEFFMVHQWKGNVRELMNLIQRAVIMTPSDLVGARRGGISAGISRLRPIQNPGPGFAVSGCQGRRGGGVHPALPGQGPDPKQRKRDPGGQGFRAGAPVISADHEKIGHQIRGLPAGCHQLMAGARKKLLFRCSVQAKRQVRCIRRVHVSKARKVRLSGWGAKRPPKQHPGI